MKKLILLFTVILLLSCSQEKLPEIQPPYILENLDNYPFFSDGITHADIKIENLAVLNQPLVVRPGELVNVNTLCPQSSNRREMYWPEYPNAPVTT